MSSERSFDQSPVRASSSGTTNTSGCTSTSCPHEMSAGDVSITPTGSCSRYLEHEPVGVMLTSPADISWGQDVLVQPDVFVVPLDEARTGDWSKLRSLLVAAEVLSPSTARADRFTKRRRYQEAGVPLYWIVDGEEQRVEVWTPDAELPTIETKRLVWRPAGAGQPFTLELAELFRPV